jgi:CDGSH-type Zn-finger protein
VDALANFALLGWDKDGDVIANFDTPLDVDFSEDRKYECSRCGHESNFCDGSEFRPEESATRYNMTDTATTRSARLASLLGNENAPLFENGFEMPSEPCRYLAIEYSSGDAIWAMVADNLGTMARAIEASDTERDSVTVFDLDTGDKLITEFQVTAFLRDNGERILTPASTPRVVIVIDSGCIQDVISDAPVKIWTIDYDTEGADDSDLAEIPQGGGETRQAYPGEYYGTQDAQLTAALITAIKA